MSEGALHSIRYEAAPEPGGILVGTEAIVPTPFTWCEPATIPRRRWLLGYWLLRSTVAAVVAPGGVGKSSRMATMLLSLASGRPLLGKTVWDGPLRAWYWNLEDDRDELQRQVAAAAIHHRISPDEIAGRLWIDSGLDGRGLCTALEGADGFKLLQPEFDELQEVLKQEGIDALIVDPFVSSHSVDENNNSRIDAVVKAWSRLARQAECAIILVHHSRKPGGQKITAEHSRGAGALINAVRSALVLNRVDQQEAERFDISGEAESKRYFSVHDDKHNRAPAEQADWFRFVSVELGNGTAEHPGDSVGVVEPWRPPDPFEDLTGEDLYRVQLEVDAGVWRKSSQVTDGTWVGVAVAKALKLDAHRDKARIKRLLSQWYQTGMLKTELRKDKRHEDRPFVAVGRWQNDNSLPAPA